jgi:hypothetical protein
MFLLPDCLSARLLAPVFCTVMYCSAINSWLWARPSLTVPACCLIPPTVCTCLQCELQSRDQQLLQLLQSEQNGCQLRTQLETQLEQQTTRLLAAQQELQQVELMWQQDCKHAAMATASTTVAW